MRLRKSQLRRIIYETVLSEPEGEEYASYDASDQRARTLAKMGSTIGASEKEVDREAVASVLSMVPGVGEVLDLSRIIDHLRGTVAALQEQREDDAYEELLQASSYAAFLLLPGVLEGIFKILKRLAARFKSADEVVDNTFKEIRLHPDFPATAKFGGKRGPNTAPPGVREYPDAVYNSNSFKSNWEGLSRHLANARIRAGKYAREPTRKTGAPKAPGAPISRIRIRNRRRCIFYNVT